MPSVNHIQRPWIKPSVQQSEKKTDPFYHSPSWRKLRALILSIDPLCYYCTLKGIIRLATIGDHFRPRKLYPELALVQENIKPCCDHCHNVKRAFEKTIGSVALFEERIGNFIKSLKK
jgi:5-methylcytosine-specific restriction endonuclease McrA